MSKCTNCNEEGAHFVPPSLGDKGFFACSSEGFHAPCLETLACQIEGKRKSDGPKAAAVMLESALKMAVKYGFSTFVGDPIQKVET